MTAKMIAKESQWRPKGVRKRARGTQAVHKGSHKCSGAPGVGRKGRQGRRESGEGSGMGECGERERGRGGEGREGKGNYINKLPINRRAAITLRVICSFKNQQDMIPVPGPKIGF